MAMAADPAGQRFCDVPIKSAQDLLGRLQRAGDGALDGCRANWRHFAAIWKPDFPNVPMDTREDVMAFVAKLKATTARTDLMYDSACLRQRPDHGWDATPGCMTREARKGEIVFVYDDKAALMSSCANPGVVEVPPIVVTAPCIRVDFPSDVRVPTRFAHMNDHALPGKCTKLQIASEQEPRYNLPEECPDAYTKVIDGHLIKVVCSWDNVVPAVSQLLHKRVQVQAVNGSFYGRTNGTNSLYLPVEALDGETVICWELPDGTVVTKGVRRDNFVDGVATIPRSEVFR
jgi:hypothetical protein